MHRSRHRPLLSPRALRVALLLGAMASAGSGRAEPQPPTHARALPLVSRELLPDIPGGAPDASLEQAAAFAWRQFIALNWPAAPGRRDTPAAVAFGDAGADARVWETFRGRVEVYPGTGQPFAKARGDYDYHEPPRYIYDPEQVGAHEGVASGEVPACDSARAHGDPPPWNNLDESNHNNVRAGLSPQGPFPGQQILLESKVNRENYVYVASRGWYGARSVRAAAKRTGAYVRQKLAAPPPARRLAAPKDTEYVSFPNQTIEVKAAWRRLGPRDDASRYYVNRVRYYRERDGKPCYVDSGAASDESDRWGLLAFHIMHKTPSAPYFVWATFEHVDALVTDELDDAGRPIPVESPDGTPTQTARAIEQPFTPALRLVPATPTEAQQLVASSVEPSRAKHQLYFHQEAAPRYDIPEIARVAINRRMHAIAKPIVEVNRRAQAELGKKAPGSPFQYYRLVSVQWLPMTKKPGEPYEGADAGIYYAANVVIEGPPVAQAFSGQFSHGTSKHSDYLHRELVFLNPGPNPGAPVFLNTFFDGKGYLAGGCMGCHGTRQAYGTDWSFLLDRQRVKAPDIKTGSH